MLPEEDCAERWVKGFDQGFDAGGRGKTLEVLQFVVDGDELPALPQL